MPRAKRSASPPATRSKRTAASPAAPAPASAPPAGGRGRRAQRRTKSLPEEAAPLAPGAPKRTPKRAPLPKRAPSPAPSRAPTLASPPPLTAHPRGIARLCSPPALFVLLALLLLVCGSLGLGEDPATDASAPAPLRKLAAALAPLRATGRSLAHSLARSLAPLAASARRAAALTARPEVAPALLMAAAAASTQLMAWTHVDARLQWSAGLALVVAAALAASRGGGGGGGFAGGRGTAEPAPLRLGEFRTALHAASASAPIASVAQAQLARLDAWAVAWQAASDGASAKLLVFGEAGGRMASLAAACARDSLLPAPAGGAPARVLELATADDCARGGCAARIEAHLASASAAGERALVVLRGVDGCMADVQYDDVLSVVERYLDETPAVQTTAHGDVRKSLAGFLLFAPCLAAERCAEIAAAGAAGAHRELVGGGDLERLWPSGRFSAPVNAAKRALINRIGSDVAAVCA